MPSETLDRLTEDVGGENNAFTAGRRDRLSRNGPLQSSRAPALGRGRAARLARRERAELSHRARCGEGGIPPERARRALRRVRRIHLRRSPSPRIPTSGRPSATSRNSTPPASKKCARFTPPSTGRTMRCSWWSATSIPRSSSSWVDQYFGADRQARRADPARHHEGTAAHRRANHPRVRSESPAARARRDLSRPEIASDETPALTGSRAVLGRRRIVAALPVARLRKAARAERGILRRPAGGSRPAHLRARPRERRAGGESGGRAARGNRRRWRERHQRGGTLDRAQSMLAAKLAERETNSGKARRSAKRPRSTATRSARIRRSPTLQAVTAEQVQDSRAPVVHRGESADHRIPAREHETQSEGRRNEHAKSAVRRCSCRVVRAVAAALCGGDRRAARAAGEPREARRSSRRRKRPCRTACG